MGCGLLGKISIQADTMAFLTANGEASWWSLLPSSVSLQLGGTVQQKTPILYPQADMSGLRKPKKDKHQH